MLLATMLSLSWMSRPLHAHGGVSQRAAIAVRMNDGAKKQSEINDSAENATADEAREDMLALFASSVEAQGGSTSVRDLQFKAMRGGAGRAVDDAGSSINKALDLDGQAGAENYPGQVGTPGGILEVGGWRATVAFGFFTILLAVYAAFTTDFGDGTGTSPPLQLCRGDERLCTRREIENSRIAEIANRNREAARY